MAVVVAVVDTRSPTQYKQMRENMTNRGWTNI